VDPRGPDFLSSPRFLVKIDQMRSYETESSHPVRAGDDPASGELVGDEPVSEGRVVGVDGQRSVDEMCVIPIALCQRRFAPLVERLNGEPTTGAASREAPSVRPAASRRPLPGAE
jgi:hypothetical protein